MGHVTALLTPEPAARLAAQRRPRRGPRSGRRGAEGRRRTGRSATRRTASWSSTTRSWAGGSRRCWPREGWNVYRLLVMVRDREPERTAAPGAGGEVRARQRARRRWPPSGASSPSAGRRRPCSSWRRWTSATGAPCGRATSRRPPRTRPPPAGSTRPRGWPRSTRSARSSAAAGRGHATRRRAGGGRHGRAPRARDPIFLLTDAADWPQQLYARLGFSPIGQLYEFLKLPLGGRG